MYKKSFISTLISTLTSGVNRYRLLSCGFYGIAIAGISGLNEE
jgi:hypothetical protein